MSHSKDVYYVSGNRPRPARCGMHKKPDVEKCPSTISASSNEVLPLVALTPASKDSNMASIQFPSGGRVGGSGIASSYLGLVASESGSSVGAVVSDLMVGSELVVTNSFAALGSSHADNLEDGEICEDYIGSDSDSSNDSYSTSESDFKGLNASTDVVSDPKNASLMDRSQSNHVNVDDSINGTKTLRIFATQGVNLVVIGGRNAG